MKLHLGFYRVKCDRNHGGRLEQSDNTVYPESIVKGLAIRILNSSRINGRPAAMESNYYHKSLIVAAVGIFYTNLPLYVYANYGTTGLTAPKYWLIMFGLLSLPILVIRKSAWNALRSPITIWCFGYAVLTLLWFFLSSQSETAWQEVRWRFLAMMQILAFLMIFGEPGATTLARKALVAAVLFSVAVNVYELFAPLSFSRVIGRSAGLYENPNITGEALVLGMIISVTVLAARYRALFILLAGIGILLTFSRAAILMWVVAVAGFLLVGGLRLKGLLMAGTVGLLLVALVLLPRWDELLTTWERTGVVNSNVQERLAWFTDPVGVSDESSWERKYVAQRAWDKVAERPFLGHGTGSSSEAYTSPHNQYLALMMDHGLIGLLIVPLLTCVVAWGSRGESRRVAIIFGCAILVLSLFTHSILTTGHSLILLTLMAAMAATNDHRQIERMAMETTESGPSGSLNAAIFN